MRTQQKWLQWEGIRDSICADAVRIRMRQNKPVHVAIRNVSAHESDKKFRGVTSLQTYFLNSQNGGKVL